MIQGLIVGTACAEAWCRQLQLEAGLQFEQDHKKQKTEQKKERLIVWRDRLDEGILQEILEAWNAHPKDCFCVVETDEAVKAAAGLGIPCIAYCNPDLPEQDFGGINLLLEGFDEIDWKFLDNVYARESGLPVEIARTERLLIREMTIEDLDALYRIYEDSETRRFVKGLDENRAAEEERFRAYIRYMYGLYQFGMWVVIENSSGALIGRAGFGIADYQEEAELDLGYLIGKCWRGRGYACEACEAVLAYGKEVLGFSKVAAYIHLENAPSLGVIRKLGFREMGQVEAENERLIHFEKVL